MDLRTLIPGLESVAGPVLAVVGDGSSGLSGLAAQVEGQDLAGMATALGGRLESELANRLPTPGTGPLTGAAGGMGAFAVQAGAPPTDLLEGIAEPLAELDRVVTRVPELLAGLRGVAEAVDRARAGDLTPLIQAVAEALGEVVRRAAGSDLTAFQSWTTYLEGLGAELGPLIDQGGSDAEIRDRLIQFVVDRVIGEIQGVAPGVGALLDGLGTWVEGVLPDVPGLGLQGLRDQVLEALAGIRAAAESGTGDVAAAVELYRTRLRTLTDAVQAALASVEAGFSSPLLTPGGAFRALGEELDRALAVRIEDFTDVQARVEELLVSVEEAVDAVDMTAVTGPITSFFTTVQEALAGVDAEALRSELDGLFGRVEELVGRFDVLMTALTARIQEWLTELTGSLTDLLADLGTQNPDGTFTFAVQQELESVYAGVDAFIQGDPSRPDAFSVKGALDELRGGLEELIDTLEAGLAGLATQLTAARDELAASLSGVQAELEGVDPRATMEQAKAALESAFQEIGGLEFDAVVDPIVAELEEIRDDLAAIDTSSLNDLLRAALKAALDTITTSNFEREITRPLLQEFDELLEHPRTALAAFAGRVNELLAKVTALSPASLLQPVQGELDRITASLDVDLKKLLEPPLNQAVRKVRRELERLDPGAFLDPLVQGFGSVTRAVDSVDPGKLLQPAQAQIDGLARRVQGVGIDALVAPVNRVFGDVDRFLEEISPERLVRPLSEPFQLAGRTLERFRPSELLAPVSGLMDRIGGFTLTVPDELIATIHGLYDDALARADGLDPTAVLGQISTAVQGLRSRVLALDPEGMLHALQSEFGRIRVSVSDADTRDGTQVGVTLDLLAPTLAFSGAIGRFQRTRTRLGAVLDSLDPAPLAERFQEARARLDELIPRALRDDITAGRLQTLIGLVDPTAWIQRLDGIYQRILDKLTALDPAALLAPLVEIWEGLRDLLRSVDLGVLTNRVSDVFRQIGEVVGSLSLSAIVEPLTRTLDPVKSMVRALDPGQLADALRARYRALLGLLEDVAVDQLVAALQAAWNRLSARVRELFDLEGILQPLTAVMEAIQELLGGLDLGELVGVLDAKLDKIRDELEEALNRVGAAFRQMLGAVPLGTGTGGGASASFAA